MNTAKLWLKKLRKYDPVMAVLVTIGGYFASQMFGGIVLIVYGLLRGWNSNEIVSNLGDSMWLTLAFSVIVYGFYILIIKSFLEWCGTKLKEIGLKMTKVWYDIPLFALAGFGVYFISALVVTTIIDKNIPAIDLNQKQELGFDTYTTGFGLVPIFIVLVIIPPVVEEIITRGFLFTGLRKKMTFIGAGLVTSIIFGAAHLQWGSEAPLLWAAAIDTFILSWVLVYLREKTGSIYPAIGLHMLKNFMAFLGLFIFHVA